MLKGYSLPLSPGGRSSLVPSPPWHYVGDLMVIEYWADPAAVRAVLPPGLDPHPTDPGRAAAIFADWQSCTDGGSELLDPARSQYMEFFIVVNALLGGKEVTTCPYIWVDRDFALMRGWFQGFPKKLGSVWMTRNFGLQNGAEPGLQPGATFGGTCAANDRRLAQGTVTLENITDTGPTHNAAQLVNVRHFPRLVAGLARQAVRARAGRRDQPRPLDLGDLGGLCLAGSVPRAQRGAHRTRTGAHGQGLPLHVRLHRRRSVQRGRSAGGGLMMALATEHPRASVAGADVSVDHFIGGRRVAGSQTFEDHSPLDWSLLAEVSRGDAETAEVAVGAAADAFPAWAALGAAGRAVHLERLADLIDANVERIARVECLDMAMLEESLRLRVIPRGARNYRAYARLAAGYEERMWESNGTRNAVQRMPSGPAVVITPWNAPFMLSTWKTAPALAAGCTVVLKPAEWSPLSCSMLADLVAEADLPPGVFNLVQGIGEEVGAALVADPRVRRISFTGSPETARHIGVAAARNLVPFTAELGGKSPLIVFADADIEAAAKKAAGQYDDGGQVCLAGTRLLVEQSILEPFLEAFNRYTDAHVLGDSRDPATTVSPLIHPDHLARVEGFVERARAAGDRIVRGGRRPDARRAVVRADADRAGKQRLGGRTARDLRARADVADVHGRGRCDRPGQQHAVRPRCADLDGLARSAPSASAARCARARCGSTAS